MGAASSKQKMTNQNKPRRNLETRNLHAVLKNYRQENRPESLTQVNFAVRALPKWLRVNRITRLQRLAVCLVVHLLHGAAPLKAQDLRPRCCSICVAVMKGVTSAQGAVGIRGLAFRDGKCSCRCRDGHGDEGSRGRRRRRFRGTILAYWSYPEAGIP